MRHLLVSLTTLALLGGSGSAVAAREEAAPPAAGTFEAPTE
jgi:hypothetical protein